MTRTDDSINKAFVNKPKELARTLDIPGLSDFDHVSSLINKCRALSRGDYSSLVVNMSGVKTFTPKALAPMAAIVDSCRNEGLRIRLSNPPKGLDSTNFRNPLTATKENISEIDVMSKVWSYNGSQVSPLTSAYMDRIYRIAGLADGVYDSMEWCLNEVLDNVNNHAESDQGFVMVTHNPVAKMIDVSIADMGIGITRSLRKSDLYTIATPLDALTQAFQKGVTRNKASNAGNGLYGLHSVVTQSGGMLDVVSGRGYVQYSPNGMSGGSNRTTLSQDQQGTYISFRIPTNKKYNVHEAFGHNRNYFLERFEEDDGSHRISVADYAHGVGTRKSAIEFNNLVTTVLNGAHIVYIDFAGVNNISSSFADDAIGKLCYDLGIINFSRRVRLINYNQSIATFIDSATWSRVASEENAKSSPVESLKSTALDNDKVLLAQNPASISRQDRKPKNPQRYRKPKGVAYSTSSSGFNANS